MQCVYEWQRQKYDEIFFQGRNSLGGVGPPIVSNPDKLIQLPEHPGYEVPLTVTSGYLPGLDAVPPGPTVPAFCYPTLAQSQANHPLPPQPHLEPGYPEAHLQQPPPGYPPVGSGYPPVGSGYPPVGIGYPPVGSGWPPVGSGYPPVESGYNPVGSGYPPVGIGYPPVESGYNLLAPVLPPAVVYPPVYATPPFTSAPVPVLHPFSIPPPPIVPKPNTSQSSSSRDQTKTGSSSKRESRYSKNSNDNRHQSRNQISIKKDLRERIKQVKPPKFVSTPNIVLSNHKGSSQNSQSNLKTDGQEKNIIKDDAYFRNLARQRIAAKEGKCIDSVHHEPDILTKQDEFGMTVQNIKLGYNQANQYPMSKGQKKSLKARERRKKKTQEKFEDKFKNTTQVQVPGIDKSPWLNSLQQPGAGQVPPTNLGANMKPHSRLTEKNANRSSDDNIFPEIPPRNRKMEKSDAPSMNLEEVSLPRLD